MIRKTVLDRNGHWARRQSIQAIKACRLLKMQFYSFYLLKTEKRKYTIYTIWYYSGCADDFVTLFVNRVVVVEKCRRLLWQSTHGVCCFACNFWQSLCEFCCLALWFFVWFLSMSRSTPLLNLKTDFAHFSHIIFLSTHPWYYVKSSCVACTVFCYFVS